MSLREWLEQELNAAVDQLAWMEEYAVKTFTAEGNGPLSEKTEEDKAEYRRRIERYAEMIDKLDGTSDSGG